MTLKKLSQLYHLKQEIKMYEQLIQKLQSDAEGTTQNLTGMPPSGNVSDKVGQIATDIADYKALIEYDKQKCKEEYRKLHEYIQSIDDSLTRQIFTLRFVECKSWFEVADSIGSSEYAVKQICYRYIKKH
ncbi:MAG: hypothetical protein PUG48_05695 [Clostridia bacterium]|nr:hypothetical protein [Clostridia bacterium]